MAASPARTPRVMVITGASSGIGEATARRLASEPGAVFRRSRILEEVWETPWFGSAKTIDVHVAALRKKLGDPSWIETVRGVGLRLHVPG